MRTKKTPAKQPDTPASSTIQIPVSDGTIETTAQSTSSSNPQAKSAHTPTATTESDKESKPIKKSKRGAKIVYAIILLVFLGLVTGVITIAYLARQDNDIAKNERLEFPDPIYSTLTGLEIYDENLNTSPTYCVQVPNGLTDGARPQAGLNQAAVVFEAIAERGITRFAAVFQNPTSSVIGPIRSLRPYYLDWDAPFDCTVVHAGGSDEALAAIRQGGQRNLDESLTYMWREQGSDRLWNNLFTSGTLLGQFNADYNYLTSNPKSFPHYTPDENQDLLRASRTCPEGEETCTVSLITTVEISFGATPSYNTVYHYNPETNNYFRYYATGTPHTSYECPSELTQPNTYTSCGEPVQLAPSVVIAMVVNEHTMADNYHESIYTTGSGSAVIFQNGTVIEGTWTKLSQNSQIVFRDQADNEIRLVPGQTWIAAVPQYGNIDYVAEEVNL